MLKFAALGSFVCALSMVGCAPGERAGAQVGRNPGSSAISSARGQLEQDHESGRKILLQRARRMIEALGVSPEKSIATKDICIAYARIGDFDEALTIADQLGSENKRRDGTPFIAPYGNKRDALTGIARALGQAQMTLENRSNLVERLLASAEKIEGNSDRAKALANIRYELLETAEMKQNHSPVPIEAVAPATGDHSDRPDHLMSTAGGGWAPQGEQDPILEALALSMRPSLLRQFVVLLAGMGGTEKAASLLHNAWEATLLIGPPWARLRDFSELVVAYADIGLFKTSIARTTEIVEPGYAAQILVRVSKMIAESELAGDEKLVLLRSVADQARSMESIGYGNAVLREVAVACVRARIHEEALRLVRSLVAAHERARALRQLVSAVFALLSSGAEMDQHWAFLEDIHSEIWSIGAPSERGLAMVWLGCLMEKAGYGADRIGGRSAREIRKIGERTAQSMADTGEIYARHGFFGDALRCAEGIEAGASKVQLIDSIARSMARAEADGRLPYELYARLVGMVSGITMAESRLHAAESVAWCLADADLGVEQKTVLFDGLVQGLQAMGVSALRSITLGEIASAMARAGSY